MQYRPPPWAGTGIGGRPTVHPLWTVRPAQLITGTAQIDMEVRIVTAVLDGIGLQWLNDPSTDIVQAVTTFIDRTIADWRRH